MVRSPVSKSISFREVKSSFRILFSHSVDVNDITVDRQRKLRGLGLVQDIEGVSKCICAGPVSTSSVAHEHLYRTCLFFCRQRCPGSGRAHRRGGDKGKRRRCDGRGRKQHGTHSLHPLVRKRSSFRQSYHSVPDKIEEEQMSTERRDLDVSAVSP